MRDVGILSGVATRAALAQQVPKLIELHFQRFEALPVFRRERARLTPFQQLMFFGNELLDMRADLGVIHTFAFFESVSLRAGRRLLLP